MLHNCVAGPPLNLIPSPLKTVHSFIPIHYCTFNRQKHLLATRMCARSLDS